MRDVVAFRRTSGTGLPAPKARYDPAGLDPHFLGEMREKFDSSLLTGFQPLINRSTRCAIRLTLPSSRSPWKSRVRTHAHSSRSYAAPDR